MNSTEDSILKMEQDAHRLVEELAALKREVGSYRAATGELEKTRVVLADFIETTQELAKETHELVVGTKSISGAQILDEIAGLRQEMLEQRKKEATARLVAGVLLLIVLGMQVFAVAR